MDKTCTYNDEIHWTMKKCQLHPLFHFHFIKSVESVLDLSYHNKHALQNCMYDKNFVFLIPTFSSKILSSRLSLLNS